MIGIWWYVSWEQAGVRLIGVVLRSLSTWLVVVIDRTAGSRDCWRSSCCRHACVSMPAGASMPSTSVSTSRSRCHCPAANSADGTSCAAFSDVADSVVMPTDESCYDEVIEATDSDVCEFGMSPTKSCQKQAKFAGLWRHIARYSFLFSIFLDIFLSSLISRYCIPVPRGLLEPFSGTKHCSVLLM